MRKPGLLHMDGVAQCSTRVMTSQPRTNSSMRHCDCAFSLLPPKHAYTLWSKARSPWFPRPNTRHISGGLLSVRIKRLTELLFQHRHIDTGRLDGRQDKPVHRHTYVACPAAMSRSGR